MKIGVISDTHGSLAAWEKALAGPFKGVDLIIHAGDVLYHGPRNPILPEYNPAALAEAINNSPVPVLFARGNCDADVDQMVLNWPLESPHLFTVLPNWRLLAHHGHLHDSESLRKLAKLYKVNLGISGHTHVPALNKVEGVIWLNPGSSALPKDNYPPSVAIIEQETVQIVSLTEELILSL